MSGFGFGFCCAMLKYDVFFSGLLHLRSEQMFYPICLQIGESSSMMYVSKSIFVFFFSFSVILPFSFVARRNV